MQISRWRNVLCRKTYAVPSITASTHLAPFHSTSCSYEKWKNKWNTALRGGPQPSKSYVKYVIRQKRADAKKALKDLLYRSGSSKFSFESQETWKFGDRNFYGDKDDDSESCYNKRQATSHQQSGKPKKKVKRKIRRETFSEESDYDSETTFQATFGNRCYTWSFRNWQGSSSEYSTSGFEWREHTNWTNGRTRNWKRTSDAESDDNDDDLCYVGSLSERTVLGLPSTGPLKLENVKNAFRLSALKWHPDKHQGPSQAVAEEKFKLCLNAYKSLCRALSPA
ncbi:uncharacterized protein LOC129320325 isoform X2 [Prosopis cineraria]|uniref:uncharacterized protein LOC129320325 isoform X2 n=1 Tax=Prosopis cineraria TaxID=364024 RepID=UPI0024109D41|nr:uncharacterized protein LOC129320325 isoform X2 [Prosopis cineraria]